ncbi:GNAT family N-acetyltransferase [Streptomyces sp. BI20]|uniref:GNAT family N-acetyltransferase n=1 Tax=Streptomyces sp. BI20 TaxID=3403460 RepID=UPI003C740CFE
MMIREARDADWDAIWPFFHEVTAAGESFTYPTDLGREEASGWWLLPAPNRTVVAEVAGRVVGSAKMNNNHVGNASHIASATYLVDPAHEGRGVGRALVEDSLAWARAQGYRAMQFNAVVETNTRAVGLYESLGFEVVGTLAEGFRHPREGYVGLHVMYRLL